MNNGLDSIGSMHQPFFGMKRTSISENGVCIEGLLMKNGVRRVFFITEITARSSPVANAHRSTFRFITNKGMLPANIIITDGSKFLHEDFMNNGFLGNSSIIEREAMEAIVGALVLPPGNYMGRYYVSSPKQLCV